MNRNTVTAFLSVFGSRLAIFAVSIFITPLLFRALSTAQFGRYGTVMAVFGLLMILVSSGINGGSRKFLSEDRDDPNWEDHVFAFYFRLAAVLAFVAAGTLVAAAKTGVVAATIGETYNDLFYLLAVLTVAAQFRAYVRRAMMGLKLEHISEPIRVVHKALFGVFGVGLAVLGYGVYGVLLGEILASTVVFVVATIAIARHVSLSAIVKPLPAEFPRWELFNFNHTSIVYNFLMMSLIHVDVIMLEYFTTGSAEVGIYKGALVIAQLLWVVPRSVQGVMVQSTSDHWANDRIAKINAIASRVVRYTALLSLLLALGLAALVQDFVPLYLTQDGAAAVIPVLLLVPGTLAYAIGRPVFAISFAKGNMRVLIVANAVAATLNFALNLVLIPRYGMYGAAVATSIGYLTLPLAHVWSARELGYQPFNDFRPARVAATTVLSAVPIVGLSLLVERSLVALVVVPPVGLVTFAVLSVLTGAVHVDEIVDLLDSLPSPVDEYGRRFERVVDGGVGGLTPSFGTRGKYDVQFLLAAIGLVLFLVGIGVVSGIPTVALPFDGNGTDGPGPASPTPTISQSTVTPGTDDTPRGGVGQQDGRSSTPDGGGATRTGPPPDRPPDTPSPAGQSTRPSPAADGNGGSNDDGGGWFGGGDWFGGGGDDESTPTGTTSPASETQTATGAVTPTATADGTATATSTSSGTATATATATTTETTGTATPTETTTATQTATATETVTTTETTTATETATATATQTATATATETATAPATDTATATATATATSTSTSDGTATATATATSSATTTTSATNETSG